MHVAHLHLIIMLIYVWAQLYLFNFNYFLLFTSFVSTLLRFIFEFSIVQYFTDWGISIWLYFYEVKSKTLSF